MKRNFQAFFKTQEIRVWGRIHDTSISVQLINGPNKVEYYITQSWKGFRDKLSKLLGPFVSCKENKCCEYNPRVCIHNTLISVKVANGTNKLVYYITFDKERIVRDKQSRLLGPFVSCTENKML
jgi:hypothetical protein